MENSVDEVSLYIVEQLAGFLLAAKAEEFETLYFDVDGQTYIEPKPQQKGVPANYYKQQSDFWNYTSDTNIWDSYWGNFAFDLFSGVTEISGLIPDLLFSNADLGYVSENTNAIGDNGCDADGCDADGCG